MAWTIKITNNMVEANDGRGRVHYMGGHGTPISAYVQGSELIVSTKEGFSNVHCLETGARIRSLG